MLVNVAGEQVLNARNDLSGHPCNRLDSLRRPLNGSEIGPERANSETARITAVPWLNPSVFFFPQPRRRCGRHFARSVTDEVAQSCGSENCAGLL